MSMSTKKDAAKALYFEGFTQTDIAALLKLAEKTVSAWKIAGGWERQRTEAALWEETNAMRIQRIAGHNLRILTEMIDEQETSGERTLIDKGHFDAIAKAMSSIKKQEMKWTDKVVMMRSFVKYVADRDRIQAEAMQPHVNAWLNEERREA